MEVLLGIPYRKKYAWPKGYGLWDTFWVIQEEKRHSISSYRVFFSYHVENFRAGIII